MATRSNRFLYTSVLIITEQKSGLRWVSVIAKYCTWHYGWGGGGESAPQSLRLAATVRPKANIGLTTKTKAENAEEHVKLTNCISLAGHDLRSENCSCRFSSSRLATQCAFVETVITSRSSQFLSMLRPCTCIYATRSLLQINRTNRLHMHSG
jgi:hypothetical protein